MKKKELYNLKSKPTEELRKIVLEKKTKLSMVKADIIASREKNLKAAKNLRHELGQILTIIRQKEIIDKLKKD